GLITPGLAYSNLMGSYTSLNRLAEAKAVYRQMQVRKIDSPYSRMALYQIAFLEQDAAEMSQQVDWSQSTPLKGLFLAAQSDTEAFFGHLGKARELSGRAVEVALHSDQKEAAAESQMDAALREVEFGHLERARQETASALAKASTQNVQILAALA